MKTKSLADCKAKDKVRIVRLETVREQNLRKMMVFGLLPGVELEILQVSPAIVIRMEHTELAIDSDIAKQVIVQKGL